MKKQTRLVTVGGVKLGGGERIKIQSMTTTKTSDVEKTVAQINALESAGCEIVRVAVSDEADAIAVREVVQRINLPLVADIHFSPKLAVTAIENGVDKVRINPGNIGGEQEIKYVADCIKSHRIPVRVGANLGSIEKNFLAKYGRTADALVESALYNVAILEKFGVQDIVISVKASSVPLTVDAYTLLSKKTDYPLHLGVTEAGTTEAGVVKSAVGIGSLLLQGIGVDVSEGMIVGECAKNEDIVCNVCKTKHLTNTRASGSDDALRLVPHSVLSLEQCMEFIKDDELLEVTPTSLRLRKRILSKELRMKQQFKKK